MIKYKICTKCNKCLPATVEYFNKCKNGKYKLNSQCKECRSRLGREYRIRIGILIPKPKPKDGYKICTKCGGEFPATTEYFTKMKEGKYGLVARCKKCRHGVYLENKSIPYKEIIGKYKTCTKCERELPATCEYFYKHVGGKYGLKGRCKQCMGHPYLKLKPIPRDGYKFCSKCKKELPLIVEYFHRVKNRKIGFNPRCKECNNEDVREYYKTPSGKATSRRNNRKNKAKRRNMGHITLLKNPFLDEIEVDYHHINNLLMVPIPKEIHKLCHAGNNIIEHRERCNIWLYYLYGIDFDLLLS